MTQVIAWVLWFLTLMHSIQAHHQQQQQQQPPPSEVSVGKATFYSDGVMQRVASMRGLGLGGATGFATYPNCRMIGGYLEVSVLNPKTQKWSRWVPKRIVDCSQPRDYQRHVAEGLVELSYQDAVLYGYDREGHTSIKFYIETGGK